MSSFLKQIETRFELFESVDLKQAANDPKAFVVDMYNQGKSKAEIVDALLDAGHHRDHAEGLATRWQDSDGDGNWYESGEDVREQLNDRVECETCKGEGCDHCDGTGYHNKVDEMSTTAGVSAPPHKFAFGKSEYPTNSTGYSLVEEALERRYENLIEGYRSYVTDNPKITSESKVKGTIREVSKRLKEIEEMVANASRLKTESGMSRDGYGKQVNSALTTISERLIKISERVRSLGE